MLHRLLTALLVLNVALASVAQASVNVKARQYTNTSASTTVGIANGTVSGELDLGEILKNAAISAGTSYLQNAVNLKAQGDLTGSAAAQQLGEAANGAADVFGNRTFNLFGEWDPNLTSSVFGNHLTAANILEGAFDASIGAGIQTVAYGGSFGDVFKGSFINSVVALGLADAQTGIGDVFAREGSGGEGSLGHVLLHGFAGCVAAEAQGADCAAGAAGGIAQAIYAGGLDSTTLTDEQQRQRAELIGAAAGWLFSGGEAQNVSTAASVALSGMINNRQLHANEKEILSDMLGRPIDDADFDTLDGVSDAERATLAAACALIKCSAHLSVNHPDYAARVALEREGWQNLTEMRRLMQAGNTYAGYDVQAEHGHLYLGGRGDRGDSGYEVGAFLYTGTDARYDWTLSAGHDIYGQKSSLPQVVLDGLLGLASDPMQLWHGLVDEVQGTAEVWAAVFTDAGISDAGEQLALKQALRGMDYADAATLAYLNGGLSNEEFRQALTDTAQAPAVLQTIVLGYAAGGYSLARGALVPRVAKPSFSGEIPESWVKLNPAGAQINTPKGFTTYRTPDGKMVHVSPAGLKYGSDPKFVNRVDHVLDHTAPNPDKPVHSVFNVQGDDALALVDEAWSRRTAPDPSDPYVYVVDLGRPIGTAGETKIRIVTMKPGVAEIRTAYPWQ